MSPGSPRRGREPQFGDQIRLGVLTEEITPEVVDEVLELTGRTERRRRLLPACAVVYFVLALCLFSSSDSAGPPGYRAVLRTLTDKLRHVPCGLVQRLPTSSALTRARQRLGDKPFQALFERRCGTQAAPTTPGAFAFGLRLVAWDGTALDVPDTPENAATFGFTGRDGTNKSGNPQVRLMALIECGTHAIIDAAFDSIARFSEHKLARRLLASLRPGILLLADRNFAGHELWGLVETTGCHLAWRIKKNLVLPPLSVLPDGSYVSVMPTPAEGQRLGNARFHGRTPTRLPQGHFVRIVDYTVTVRPQHRPVQVEKFRLATSLLDHRHAPARQLAQLYHQRWEIENGFAELKNRLRGAPAVQDPRAHLPGNLRAPHRLPGTERTQSPRSRTGKGRSRPDLFHHNDAARAAQDRRTDRSEPAGLARGPTRSHPGTPQRPPAPSPRPPLPTTQEATEEHLRSQTPG
ncbi:IS4 family transposase [Streptomyces sp. NPDC046984]|uniref:IS4 family transposase n=1 Tax=Streptomyces sp. NPDC046984 TaxID=3155138 RepID=UPI0033F67FC8